MSRIALRRIKVVHTAIWAKFASCIVAIPVLAVGDRVQAAVLLAVVVLVEVLVLVFNHWRCPLTDIAARHTADRRDNFDIYLPEWLARHNKTIFGTLYALGLLLIVLRWAVTAAVP